MKLFGYSRGDEIQLLELREVTLSADPKLLRAMAEFLSECADGIEAKGTTWEHAHFEANKDFAHEDVPQFIVFNSDVS